MIIHTDEIVTAAVIEEVAACNENIVRVMAFDII